MASAVCVSATAALGAVLPARRVAGKNAPITKTMSSFSGLKASSAAVIVSEKKSFEECFAIVAAESRKTDGKRGGALTSRCEIAEEIFKIIPIMSGLTLLGIALGFVLLRVEAAVEESE